MIKELVFILMLFNWSCYSCMGQRSEGEVVDPEFAKTIEAYLNFSIPTISCDSLQKDYQKFLLLDAREISEYNVSHLPGAKHIGYQKLDLKNLKGLSKDTPIVVYCSIGYRSEKIGEVLQKEGFTNISNLYGSIFAWVNRGYQVVDTAGYPANEIHTYNKKWSRWVVNDSISKTW